MVTVVGVVGGVRGVVRVVLWVAVVVLVVVVVVLFRATTGVSNIMESNLIWLYYRLVTVLLTIRAVSAVVWW